MVEYWKIVLLNGFSYDTHPDNLAFVQDGFDLILWIGSDDDYSLFDEIWKIWTPSNKEDDEDHYFDLLWENPFQSAKEIKITWEDQTCAIFILNDEASMDDYDRLVTAIKQKPSAIITREKVLKSVTIIKPTKNKEEIFICSCCKAKIDQNVAKPGWALCNCATWYFKDGVCEVDPKDIDTKCMSEKHHPIKKEWWF